MSRRSRYYVRITGSLGITAGESGFRGDGGHERCGSAGPGITFYTQISDLHAPFYTKVISTTVRDATHILDGLLYHEADHQIEEHYTDTLGFTDHVFALCHLLVFPVDIPMS